MRLDAKRFDVEFAIALLVVAAFLFITGVAGPGAAIGGPGFSFTFKGKVGPIPRAVFVCVSAAMALAAVGTFVIALPQPTPSSDSTNTPIINRDTGSGTSPPSSPGGSSSNNATGGGSAANNTNNSSSGSGNANAGSGTSSGGAAPAATVDLIVGIRPALGQVSEDMKLIIDGRTAASWHADQQQPTKTVKLTLKPGQLSYQLQGTYSYVYAGAVVEQEYSGTGTIAAVDGASYGINYSPPNQFQIVRTS